MLLKTKILFLFIDRLFAISYEEIRNNVLIEEETASMGGNLILNPIEEKVNNILMKYKTDELVAGYKNPELLLPSRHFFKSKKLIDKSKIYKFLQNMPKGGLLHLHNTAAVSSEWIIKNLTYYPDILKCTNKNGIVVFTFRKDSSHDCANYTKISEERKQLSNNTENYDQILEKHINLYTPQPETEYPYITVVWKKFQNMFVTVGDLLKYVPVHRAYHWRLLEEMYFDGIIYIELRISMYEGYDDDGRIYSMNEMLKELQNVVERFKELHADFLGLKVIYTINRMYDEAAAKEKLDAFTKLYFEFPDFVIGFDLVGQEDLGKPLYSFAQLLKNVPAGVKYFFHAGETNWYGSSTDVNILDAILLNTTRIGHGFALLKHPILLSSVKRCNIAIEINPISNQVLNLVSDLRNHPASFYISENIPIIISNDDPGFWNAKGISYDYYYALMSMASNRAGLKFLKQLIWNSLKYSILNETEKQKAVIILLKRWDIFLNDILSKF